MINSIHFKGALLTRKCLHSNGTIIIDLTWGQNLPAVFIVFGKISCSNKQYKWERHSGKPRFTPSTDTYRISRRCKVKCPISSMNEHNQSEIYYFEQTTSGEIRNPDDLSQFS